MVGRGRWRKTAICGAFKWVRKRRKKEKIGKDGREGRKKRASLGYPARL